MLLVHNAEVSGSNPLGPNNLVCLWNRRKNMSADNGIYIGCFGDGKFRVIHSTAIENLNYKPNTDDGFNASEVVSYYGGAESRNTKEAAYALADTIERGILSDDMCPVLEYGISEIRFQHPFSYYQEHKSA